MKAKRLRRWMVMPIIIHIICYDFSFIFFFRVILSIVWALKCDGMPWGKITIIAQWCKQEKRNKYIHPSCDITQYATKERVGVKNLFLFIYIWYSAKPERMSLVFSYTSAKLLSQRIAYPSIAFKLSKAQRIYFHSTPTSHRKMVSKL